MAEAKKINTNAEESNIKISRPIGYILANRLDEVMMDRTNMKFMEEDIDRWVKSQTDRSQEKRTEVLLQLKTAIGCIESIYSRVAMSYVG